MEADRGSYLNEAHKADELIGHALTLDTKTEAFKLASKLADGSVHKNNYNVGELLRAYVEAGGDTAFMSILNTEASTNTQEAVWEQDKAESPETGVTLGAAAMTSSQIEQSVQEGIRRNAAINPEAMQKTVSDGMSALIGIETRVKTESANVNHPGIGIDSVHDAYMGYLRGEMALDTTAWSMAEAIKTVMQTQVLSEAEATQLTEVLTEIVGDVELAQAYVEKNSSIDRDGDTNEVMVKSKRENRPYAYLVDPPSVGPGKKFNKSQKENIIAENMNKNGGVVKSDMSGMILSRPQKSQKGITPSPYEWKIDHIKPRNDGGSNSYSNAQVLSRKENREKSDKWND